MATNNFGDVYAKPPKSRAHLSQKCTEIGKKALLSAKLQPGGARKRINAT